MKKTNILAMAVGVLTLMSFSTVELPITTEPDLPIDSKNLILFKNHTDSIFRINTNDGKITFIRKGVLDYGQHVDYNPSENALYTTAWKKENQIIKVPLNSSEEITNIADGLFTGGQGIAIDNDNIFYGLYYNGVSKYSISTKENQLIVDKINLEEGKGSRGGLKLDKINKHVYFRSTHNGPCGECAGRKIWRVDYDGNNLTSLYKANNGDALTLDVKNSKMYFSDAVGLDESVQVHNLYKSDLDGKNAELFYSIPCGYNYIQSIVLDENNQNIYLSISGNANQKNAIIVIDQQGKYIKTLYTWNWKNENRGTIVLEN